MVAQLQRNDIGALGTPESGVREFTLGIEPGQVVGLNGLPGSGLTRLGLSFLAPYAHRGPVAYLDVRGWGNPAVAWELGIPPDRLVMVRSGEVVSWSRIVATLLPGVRGVYAEVPAGVRDSALRKLAAKARVSRTPLVLRPVAGALPSGIAHLRLESRSVTWEGTDTGHGQLQRRRAMLDAAGKAIRGMQRTIEVEDDGTHDLCVVPDMGTPPARRLA
ncbi:MAG: hypothetical protein ACR2N2_07900 [Acidimicrobiia bacterium]